MKVIIIDIIFLIVFGVFVSFLLFKNKKKLKQEGALILYRTKIGVRFIDYIGKKFEKQLKIIRGFSISLGYILMLGVVYLIIRTAYIYLTTQISRSVKAPPVMPLIPYFTEFFGLSELFPPFYFTYFLIAIVIVASVHELSHGIFAKIAKVRIKSTGFAFLKYFPLFFGAFVEQDEKEMKKRGFVEQAGILSAGVFANIIAAIVFFIILVGYFHLAFSPIGVYIDNYAMGIIPINQISKINNITINNTEEALDLLNKSINASIEDKSGIKYFGVLAYNEEYLASYFDSPALKARLKGAIVKINNESIKSLEDLKEILKQKRVGENISIVTYNDGKLEKSEITLKKNPFNEKSPWIGISVRGGENFIKETFKHFLSSTQKKNLKIFQGVYYKEKFYSAEFFYYLFWWIVLINLLVALFNMLPFAGLDGGQLFYITSLKITRSEKISKKIIGFFNLIILIILALLMTKWIFSFF